MSNTMNDENLRKERERLTVKIEKLQQRKSELKRKNSQLFELLGSLVGYFEESEGNTDA